MPSKNNLVAKSFVGILMSRIAKDPVIIPDSVNITIEGQHNQFLKA